MAPCRSGWTAPRRSPTHGAWPTPRPTCTPPSARPTISSASPEHAEAAAREWLDAINRLNAAVRDATRLIELGGAELRVQMPDLDRLGMDADAARIAADNAAEACQASREGLAACEEAVARAKAAAPAVPAEPEEEHPFARVWPAEEPALTPSLAVSGSVGVSSIIRVLRGDRDARERIVAALAGPDPDAQREWHLRLAQLVDAITAKAIEDGYLDLPADDPFWGLFEARESRDIVGALSALGFRYDGMGGFADGRVPAARDLALAVGYAGLDRMRIRTWPREDTMGGLYSRATVAADEWLADLAGDLSLGRMVDALGSRAAALADTWNAWGRVRLVLWRSSQAGSPPSVWGGVVMRRPLVLLRVLLDHDDPERLPCLGADRLPLLARPIADPPLQAFGVTDLARVRTQRRELPVERATHVHPRRGVVRPEQVQAPDDPRLEAVTREPREGQGVAGGRVDRINGGEPEAR